MKPPHSAATEPGRRILFCTQSAYVGGGVEEWLWQLVAELHARGWETVVGLALGKRFHLPTRFLESYPYANSVVLDARTGFAEQRRLALLDAFRRIDPDIIMPVQLADALYAAVEWKRQGGKARLVTCLHGQFADIIADFAAVAEDIDLAVSVSRRGRDSLLSVRGLPPERVCHIPTGVPSPAHLPPPQSRPRAIGYIGRLDQPEKRIHDLIPLVGLLERVPDLVVHVVGDGPETSYLRGQLSEAETRGRVVFHGRLSRSAVWQGILPNLRGLLVFSPAEGGPITAWEALANGVIPVTSDYLGRAEEGVLVEDVNSLVFPVGDVGRAAEQIENLLDDVRYARLFAHAVALDARYTLSGFADGWDGCFASALGLPRRTGKGSVTVPLSGGRLPQWGIPAPLIRTLRRILHRSFAHAGPGGEWPHTYGGLGSGRAPRQ